MLTISGCKTTEYVYPSYDYPVTPAPVIYDKIIINKLIENMTVEQKQLFAEFLKDIDDKQNEWELWAAKVIELTTNE